MYSTTSIQQERNLIKEGLRIFDLDNSFIITQGQQDALRQYLGDLYFQGEKVSIQIFNAFVQSQFDLDELLESMYEYLNPDC